MKKHYPWLWFDADGTLFDYNSAETVALQNTFHSLQLPFEEGYLNIYREINHRLWQALEKQEITPAALRFRRFELLLQELQLNASYEEMSNIYVEQLASCAELMDGARDVLESLHKHSRIAIVTNGLQSVQRSRLAHSVIKELISDIIISEEIGKAKPDAAFFETAAARLAARFGSCPKTDILIIGDSLTSDIQGGVNYGIDTCWYNPGLEQKPDGLPITYEIRRLNELLDLLE
jgi:2-haloacid dehalogenase